MGQMQLVTPRRRTGRDPVMAILGELLFRTRRAAELKKQSHDDAKK